AGARRGRPGLGRRDPAEFVLVEHEGGDLEPGRSLRCAEHRRRSGVTEMAPLEDHLDTGTSDAPRAVEPIERITAPDHGVEDADLHQSRASSTGCSVRADSQI